MEYEKRVRCGAQSQGRRCIDPTVPYFIAGGLTESAFCKKHTCPYQDKDSRGLCAVPKLELEKYCAMHSYCHYRTDGIRCTQRIKDANPNKHRYCDLFHCCRQRGCSASRIAPDGADQVFCSTHRCETAGCTSARVADGYSHCVGHTCEEPFCTAFLADKSVVRSCERHRRCGDATCTRFVHVREDGQASPYCGAHYCRWKPLSNTAAAATCFNAARVEGGFCGEHSCSRPDCAGMIAGDVSRYCKKHECDADACLERRMLVGSYCGDHRCARRPCLEQVDDSGGGGGGGGRTSGYCKEHLPCPEAGCGGLRAVKDGAVEDLCEAHMSPKCTRVGCGRNAIGTDKAFCEAHLCRFRDCSLARAGIGCAFCAVHKCAVVTCAASRSDSATRPPVACFLGRFDYHRREVDREIAETADAAEGGLAAGSAYCVAHSCSRAYCRERSVAGTRGRTCAAHGECASAGCRRQAMLAGVGEGNGDGDEGGPDQGSEGGIELAGEWCREHWEERRLVARELEKKKLDAENEKVKKRLLDEMAAEKKQLEEEQDRAKKQLLEEIDKKKKKQDEEKATAKKKLLDEIESEKKRRDEQAANAKKRLLEEMENEKKRLDEEMASARKKLLDEMQSEKKRQDDEAASAKRKLLDEMEAEKKRQDEETARVQKRLQEETEAEKKRQDEETEKIKKRLQEEAEQEKKRLADEKLAREDERNRRRRAERLDRIDRLDRRAEREYRQRTRAGPGPRARARGGDEWHQDGCGLGFI